MASNKAPKAKAPKAKATTPPTPASIMQGPASTVTVPRSTPVNKKGNTVGFLHGKATAQVYPLCQNVPAQYTGTGKAGSIAYNTVNTQVGHYNTWAQGGTPTQGPPRAFSPGA